MSGRVYKSSDLIKSIKRKGMLPETQITFSEQDFLDFATEEMDLGIMPLVLSYYEDYYSFYEEITVNHSTMRIKIPHRAVGNKLRFVGIKRNSGVIPLFKANYDDIHAEYHNLFSRHYYIENDELVFPTNLFSDNDKVVLSYYLRPNALVPDEYMCRIVNISGNTLTVSGGDLSLYTTSDKIDVISDLSPNKILAIDLPIVSINVSLNQITLSNVPSNVNVGQYICLAEKTAIVQIPTELQSLLSQRVVARCLEALGDQAGLQAANTKIAEIEQKATTLLSPRVESNSKKIIGSRIKFRRI
ncbi:MAG: hypothetical protein ABIM30_01110 [candidate division WOR-3 bacterium]